MIEDIIIDIFKAMIGTITDLFENIFRGVMMTLGPLVAIIYIWRRQRKQRKESYDNPS